MSLSPVKSVKTGFVAITKVQQIVTEKCYIEEYEIFCHLDTVGSGGGCNTLVSH